MKSSYSTDQTDTDHQSNMIANQGNDPLSVFKDGQPIVTECGDGQRSQLDHPSDLSDYQGEACDPIGVTKDGQPVVAERGDGQRSRLDHLKDEGPNKRLIPFKFANTTFYADDAWAADRERYEQLWTYHHQWNDDSTARRTHQDKLHVAKALANALDLSRYQKDRVSGIVAHLNSRQFNRNGGIVGLALGAIAYVGDQDADSLDDRIVTRDKFTELCERFDVDGRTACKKIKEVYREIT